MKVRISSFDFHEYVEKFLNVNLYKLNFKHVTTKNNAKGKCITTFQIGMNGMPQVRLAIVGHAMQLDVCDYLYF